MNTFYVWIAKSIYIQSLLIAAVAGAALLLLFWRRVRDTRLKALMEEYQEKVLEGLVEGKDPALTASRPHELLKRRALREVLRNHMQVLSGKERESMVRTYIALGLAKSDKELCLSLFWWKRLRGVVNLSLLECNTTAGALAYAGRDKNPLVANAALIGLSALDHKFNNLELLKYLHEKAFTNHSFLVQLGSNWARIRGHQFVIDCLHYNHCPNITKAFVAAISELNSPEAGAALVEWMAWMYSEEREFSAETRVHILRTLKISGDPSFLPIARIHFRNEDDHVRAEALDMWLRVAKEEWYCAVSILKEDESVPVRRVWYHHEARMKQQQKQKKAA